MHKITINSTLAELPCSRTVVVAGTLVGEVAQHFRQHPECPGIIIAACCGRKPPW